MNLGHWSTTDEIEIGKGKCTCISWNLSMFDAPMLVIGTSDGAIKVCMISIKLKSYNTFGGTFI